MKGFIRRKWLVIGIVASVLVAAGIAYATIPDASGVYTACKLNVAGTIRLIDPSLPSTSPLQHCTSLESRITWNQQGQPGPAGPPGPPGTVANLDQLAGIPCDHGNGQTRVSYAPTGAVSLKCAGPTLTISFPPLDISNGIGNVEGNITSSPAGIDCSWHGVDQYTSGTCSYEFLKGTIVTLTAVSQGAQFPWTGCDAAPGTCTVTMNGNRTVSTTWGQ